MTPSSSIVDQLVQQGVFHFCIAPGSRSTPLVNAAARHPKVKIHVHYDERGLAFFALGLSSGLKEAVALIVTSGTALGNLLPAVMEAHHACIPLILLTADRPPELRDCGANQTTDQVKLFQPFVRWQTELPTHGAESYFRSTMAQGYFHSQKNPPGPVHINCAFTDPLFDPHLKIQEGKKIELHFPKLIAPPYYTPKANGVILIGKLPSSPAPILELAKRLQWPILADILSNARCTPTEEQIRYFDWMEKPTPDFILHFGERMTSKRVLDWLTQIKAETIHVSPLPQLQDPSRILSGRIQTDIDTFCQTFEAAKNPNWLSSWEDREPIFKETGSFTEVHAMRQIAKLLPESFGVFLGNGMPIRDADHFLFPKKCAGFFGNRGLSGIDGNIATLAGLAEVRPMLGIIGDQTALHDLNSLPLLKKTQHPVLLLISNNFGGGIFHHLPIVHSPHFEELWAASHTLRFEHAAKMFGLPYHTFSEDLFMKNETALIELCTNRAANYEYQAMLKTQLKGPICHVLIKNCQKMTNLG